MARIAPLALLTSKVIRLERLYRGSVYKAELGQLQLALTSVVTVVDDLVTALVDLVPPGDETSSVATDPA